MSTTVFVDGRFHSDADATVSVFDHGLLYGDGVFEGIRAYNGRVFKLERHVDRLFDSAKAIRLEIPLSPEEMTEAIVAGLLFVVSLIVSQAAMHQFRAAGAKPGIQTRPFTKSWYKRWKGSSCLRMPSSWWRNPIAMPWAICCGCGNGSTWSFRGAARA